MAPSPPSPARPDDPALDSVPESDSPQPVSRRGLGRFSAAALAVLVLVYGLLAALDEAAARLPSDDANIARIAAAAEVGPVDVLLLGSSHTYSGIDAALLAEHGVNAYNLGEPTAGGLVVPLIYQDWLASTGRQPRVVVVDVSLITVSNRGDNLALYPIHRHLLHPLRHEEVAWRLGMLDQLPRMLVKGARQGTRRIAASLLQNMAARAAQSVKDAVRTRGYKPSNKVYGPAVAASTRHLYQPLKDARPSEERMTSLQAWLDARRKDGIVTVVVDIPTFRLSEFFDPSVIAAHQRYLDELSLAGHVVIRGGPGLKPHHYRNLDHLNSEGARAYTLWLIAQLRDRGVLRAKRGTTTPE